MHVGPFLPRRAGIAEETETQQRQPARIGERRIAIEFRIGIDRQLRARWQDRFHRLDADEIVGVLQLLNAQEPDTNKIIAFDIYQQLVIETLASQVAIALKNQEILERQTTLLKMEYDLQVGHGIQENFLPKDDDLPEPDGWDISARLYPARQVAGDFYDVFEMTHNRVGFLVGDVCDKGVGAALFMALMRSLTRAFAQQVYPSSLSDALDEESVGKKPSKATLMRDRRSGPSGGIDRSQPPARTANAARTTGLLRARELDRVEVARSSNQRHAHCNRARVGLGACRLTPSGSPGLKCAC